MKLFYRKYGNGPALVILHGLYGSSDNWVSIAGKLSGRFTVYLPDLRNHGSSPHSGTHDYSSMASDVFEFVSDLKLRQFILAGHSMGGKVAMKFALEWPEMLQGLIIVDIGPSGSDDPRNPFYREHRKILEALAGSKAPESTSRDEVEKRLSPLIEDERTRSFIMKNLRRTPAGTFKWKLNIEALLANLGRITDSVPGIDDENAVVSGFPVIFIRGGESGYLMPESFEGIRKVFPAAEIKTVDGAGHWVHAEKPDEIIAAFLNIASGG